MNVSASAAPQIGVSPSDEVRRAGGTMVSRGRNVPAWSAPRKHARAFGDAMRHGGMRGTWAKVVHIIIMMALLTVPTGTCRPSKIDPAL